jgi:hypothetical protein
LISVRPEEEFRNVLKSSSFLFEAGKEEAKEKIICRSQILDQENPFFCPVCMKSLRLSFRLCPG